MSSNRNNGRRDMIILVCVSALAFGLSFSLSDAELHGQWLRSESRISQLALALRIHHEKHGQFPSTQWQPWTNGPSHSWRVLLMPQLLGASDYDFSQEWNSPDNLQTDDSQSSICFRVERGGIFANCLAVGDGEEWPSEKPLGAFLVKQGSDRFLLVYDPDSTIHWMEPKH